MKKTAAFVLALMLMSSQALFAKKKSLPEIQKIIPLSQLSSDMIEDLAAGKLSDIAIECESGTELVPKLAIKVPVLSLKINPPLSLKVDEPFYFRVVGKKLYFSPDCISWSREGKRLVDCDRASTKVKLGDDGSTVLIEASCSE